MVFEASTRLARVDLVRGGLCEATRRDLDRPRHWRGLTAVDAGLLAVWVSDHRVGISELHTDVLCGLVPVLEGELDTAANRAGVAALHPLRIDACAWFENAWWILECKPSAGHAALGQVLCYGEWGPRGNERLDGASLGIVTDRAHDSIRRVCEKYGVTLFEVGGSSRGVEGV